MSAADIVQKCRQYHVNINLDHGVLKVGGSPAILEKVKPLIVRYKTEIIDYLKSEALNEQTFTDESLEYAGHNTAVQRAFFQMLGDEEKAATRRHYKWWRDELFDLINTFCDLVRCTSHERQHMLNQAATIDCEALHERIKTFRGLINQFTEPFRQ